MFELAKAIGRQLEQHDHTHIDLAKSCWVVEMVLLDFTNLLAPCLVGQVSCWDENLRVRIWVRLIKYRVVRPDFGPIYGACTRTRVQTKGHKGNMRHPSGKGVLSPIPALKLIHVQVGCLINCVPFIHLAKHEEKKKNIRPQTDPDHN